MHPGAPAEPVLVAWGITAAGKPVLLGLEPGNAESTDAWAELLRDCRRRGMRAPVVMVGDGALGLWRALREVFPATRAQRCWVHYAEQWVMPSWDREPLRHEGLELLKSA